MAAVARTLGVAASTLRTWDRRYGLGPSGHQAGSHRRYTPDDVARLQTMRRLTLRGVAPADAARIATESGADDGHTAPDDAPAAADVDDGSLALDPLTLAAAAIEPDLRRVHRMLQRATRQAGVVAVWTDLVQPAEEMVDQGRQQRLAERPGTDPHGIMHVGLMQAIRELVVSGPAPVRILAAMADRVRAHVIAGGLAENDISALVVGAEHAAAVELEAWLPPREATVLAVIGNPPATEDVVTRASERGDVEVFLLGNQSPSIWLRQVHRVRTAQAAVAEITAAVRE